MTRLVECVPNFSEGRDVETVEALAAAVSRTPGAALLDRTADADHNRSVLTFAGQPEAVADAVLASVRVARDRIDLNRHAGVHPRLGAADVIPLIALRGLTLEQCADLAVTVGERIWEELAVPVYLYEAAARLPGRRRLEDVRRGRFEQVRHLALKDPLRAPDIGGPALHATAGAAIVGARRFLIAWNVNLATTDAGPARQIARTIRESSGGLPCVKSIGLELESRGLTQVSVNLTDFERTPLSEVFAAILREAGKLRVGIAGAELIGLLPLAAWEDARKAGIPFDAFGPERVIEYRIESLLGESVQ